MKFPLVHQVPILAFFDQWYLKCISLGIPRPKATDQPSLIAVVVKLVKKMIPQFNNSDVRYVRCPRTGKNGVLNVECRNVNVASAVKSTFAGLVKSEKPPSYLKNVGCIFFLIVCSRIHIILLNFGTTWISFLVSQTWPTSLEWCELGI